MPLINAMASFTKSFLLWYVKKAVTSPTNLQNIHKNPKKYFDNINIYFMNHGELRAHAVLIVRKRNGMCHVPCKDGDWNRT